MVRPQTSGPCFCIYCNNEVDPDKDEFVITKSKNLRWFHKRCYFVYKTIGFNPIEEGTNEKA